MIIHQHSKNSGELPPIKISYKEFSKIPIEQLNGIYDVENWATFYYVNGKLHREDGPAEDCYFDKCWYINGKLHRLDGPAIEGNEGQENYYYVEGVEYSTKEEFEAAVYLYKNGLQDYL